MKLYSEGRNYKLYEGNMLDMLEVISPNSIDSIITDPPYELNFMNRGWDNSGVAFQKETWQRCFDVLKPGGYLLSFGASRNFHRVACAIEDAGFEIRDCIMWLYGSAMPHGMNIGLAIDKKNGVDNRTGELRTDGKATNSGSGCYNYNSEGEDSMTRVYEERAAQNKWSGWNTQLKPSYEPVIIARKPCEGTCIDNVLKYGVGGMNLDACRIPTTDYLYNHGNSKGTVDSVSVGDFGRAIKGENRSTELGRFPSNVILTYDETDQEEVCGGMPDTKSAIRVCEDAGNRQNDIFIINRSGVTPRGYEDEGSASRYFYCAKASNKDRDEGLEKFERIEGGTYHFRQDGSLDGQVPKRRNIHETVKPCELMQYLIRLVTPKNGVILDCFNGSGSTGKAAMYENYERDSNYTYIGIELTSEYLPIANARIGYIANMPKQFKLF